MLHINYNYPILFHYRQPTFVFFDSKKSETRKPNDYIKYLRALFQRYWDKQQMKSEVGNPWGHMNVCQLQAPVMKQRGTADCGIYIVEYTQRSVEVYIYIFLFHI